MCVIERWPIDIQEAQGSERGVGEAAPFKSEGPASHKICYFLLSSLSFSRFLFFPIDLYFPLLMHLILSLFPSIRIPVSLVHVSSNTSVCRSPSWAMYLYPSLPLFFTPHLVPPCPSCSDLSHLPHSLILCLSLFYLSSSTSMFCLSFHDFVSLSSSLS